MRRTTVEYEHCLQKRGAGQAVKVGIGRKTSRSLRKRGVGQNIEVDGGWDGGRRRGGAAEVVGDARWDERLHGRFEDVTWVRILKWATAGTAVCGGAAAVVGR
jgi:hypothetical protein